MTFDTLQMLSVISLVLTIVGTLGNSLIFLTCVLRLRKQVTFVFLAFMSVMDTASLYEWNLAHFIDNYVGRSYMTPTLVTCRLFDFVQYLTLQSSAWLLVRTFVYTRVS